MKKNIIYLFLITQIFAFAGFGVYGSSNPTTSTALSTTDGNITITPGPMNSPVGAGFFIYLDVIPVVDLEASWEVAAAKYPFIVSIEGTSVGTNDFPWARVSGYYTVRKSIASAGIPFLAKAQFYGGIGFNTHSITPDITASFIEDAFLDFLPTNEVDIPAKQDFSDQVIIDQLTTYMNKHSRTATGFHVQVGAQAKLLFVNLFINARYTVAKDVVYGTSGFSTIWTGLAIGL